MYLAAKVFDIQGYRVPQSGIGGISFVGDNWRRNVSFVGSTAYTIDMEVKNFMKKDQEENKERRDILVDILKINLDWNMLELSDGQRRRVQIMLGLLKPFKLLLLDEITSELDIIVRRNFLDYLKKETIKNNSSIVYATHIIDGLPGWITSVAYLNHEGEMKLFKNIKDII